MKKIILPFVLFSIFIFNSCKYDRPLKRELLNIWNEDQDIREKWGSIWKKYGEGSPSVDSILKIVRYQDSIHLIRIAKILDEKGWVGKDKIGKLANNTFFVVIQHSDLKTQQKYLPMMRIVVKEGKTEAVWLALLEDRVAIGEGRKQTYGSQTNWDKKTKKHYVLPIEDPDNVDKRRAAVGLDPLAHYLKQWNIDWNVDEHKRQQSDHLLHKEMLKK